MEFESIVHVNGHTFREVYSSGIDSCVHCSIEKREVTDVRCDQMPYGCFGKHINSYWVLIKRAPK